MIVNKQKPIIFINDCGCIVDYNMLEEAILWYSNKPTTSIKHIYLHGNYPAVSIFKEKFHVHRLLMMYKMGKKLLRSEHVHHLDKNRLNCLIENLRIMDASEHTSTHLKGVKKSEEFRKIISERNKKRKGIKIKKSVNIPLNELKMYLKEGLSINNISKIFGCDWTTVKARIDEYGLNDLRKSYGKKYLKYGRNENPELLKND
jgi:hypothetical protein